MARPKAIPTMAAVPYPQLSAACICQKLGSMIHKDKISEEEVFRRLSVMI
jgi:hypothetical protein